MFFNQKRSVLLTSVAFLFLLSILDITFLEEDIFERFGNQFVNGQKMEEISGASRANTQTAQFQSEIAKKDIQEVILASRRGKVTVMRSDSSNIRLDYTVTAKGADTEAATRRREAVTVEENIQNGQLTLVTKANGKSIDPDYVSVDYVLSLPDGMKTVIQNEDGTVRISGVNGNVSASSVSGLMEIVEVKGELSVNSTNGSLYIADITGNVVLVSRSSKVNMDQTQGNLVLDTQSGITHLTDITGKVTGTTQYGSVYFREMKGLVDVMGRGSDMQFDHMQGDTRIESKAGGDMTFILPKDEGYTLDAAVSGGRIQTLLPLPIQTVKDSEYDTRMSGIVGKGTRKVDVKMKSGDLIVQGK
ncbi:hypothetical protein [Paenibacillus oryzisoli]|uniref:Adhesin domain-containing protein n=1 Tax=Paenibacillus oryzisoli TaxID=1850517 RepID=A0A198A1F9_9BACL|nr:hypothetical protein [Paenibacillus oryzisoli]OAS14856.1 hypothetical protein A8708_04975 [Paenibacillus oryzisoli]